ncbi:MAG TPA: TlpA disulfide reductase family protein [Terriglobales bacterium]|nr:TlpA disulfide reductase family protein [Terriglobales bacterium]
MAVLTAGASAPEIRLKSTEGKDFSLKEANAPVVAAFFKVGCPTCQYTFPFLERIHQAYPKERVRVVGISQDDADKTAAFIQEYKLTFPILLDDTKKYLASNAYQLMHVPSTFVIGKDGKVEMTSIGWVKDEFQQINEMVAQAAGLPAAPIFQAGEDVKDFKAG